MEAALPWPLRRRAGVWKVEAQLRAGDAPGSRHRARPPPRRPDDHGSARAGVGKRAGLRAHTPGVPRTRTLIAVVTLTTAGAITAAVVGIRIATQPPSGAVTNPTEVAEQFQAYIEKKHPERGKARAGGAPCLRERRHLFFEGYPIFTCLSPEPKSTPGTTYNPALCVISTKHGLKTSEDDPAKWPKICEKIAAIGSPGS